MNADSGRHGGCRLRFDGDGQLLIGTGDNAVGTNPQDLSTLAGKLLRVDPQTGQPSADNPFLELTDPTSHAIVGYGHRNVQGIAVQPGTGAVWTAEQGSQVDDEVNLATDGGNYGWDPVGQGEYDESVPMTDPEIPGAIAAVWSSGDPTIAVSGITFLDGEQWGAYDGLLLLGVQKDTGSSRCGSPTTGPSSSSSASPSSRAPTAGAHPAAGQRRRAVPDHRQRRGRRPAAAGHPRELTRSGTGVPAGSSGHGSGSPHTVRSGSTPAQSAAGCSRSRSSSPGVRCGSSRWPR